jgi:hypothetical protein
MLSKNLNASIGRSASNRTLCGAIFDVPARLRQFDKLEEQISAPDFWSNPEPSRKLIQERSVAAHSSDLDALFELAREGEAPRRLCRLGGHPISLFGLPRTAVHRSNDLPIDAEIDSLHYDWNPLLGEIKRP